MEEFKREKKRKHEGKQEKKNLEKSGVLTKYTFLYYKRRTSTGLYQTMTKRRIHSVYVPSSFPSSSSSSSSSSHHSFAPLMHTIFFFFFFFFFFFLSPPPHIFATAETKKEACPLLGENAGAAAVTRSYDDEATKPLISSCGNSISKSGACATCASAIDALILSRMNLTSEELKEFDMKSCAAFFIQSGASVKTLLGMKECKREDSSAYRVLLNEENGRKQREEEERKDENKERKEDKARDPSMLYCFLFFCSFPLLDIGISEMIVPFYFAFVFIASLAVLSVFLCKIFLIRRRQRRRRKEKGIHVDEDDNQAREISGP